MTLQEQFPEFAEIVDLLKSEENFAIRAAKLYGKYEGGTDSKDGKEVYLVANKPEKQPRFDEFNQALKDHDLHDLFNELYNFAWTAEAFGILEEENGIYTYIQ